MSVKEKDIIIKLRRNERRVERKEGDETMQSLTSNEVAGFAVGALLLGATIAAPKVDAFIAAAQRTLRISLGSPQNQTFLRNRSCSD